MPREQLEREADPVACHCALFADLSHGRWRNFKGRRRTRGNWPPGSYSIRWFVVVLMFAGSYFGHLMNRGHVHSTAGSSSKHLRWRIPFSTIESEPHREWSEQIESSSSTRTDPSGPVSGLLKKAGAPWRGGRRRSRHSTGRQPLLCQQRRSRFTAKSRGCQRGRRRSPCASGLSADSPGPGQVRHGSLF